MPSGTARTAVAARGLSGTRMNPARSAPASAAAATSSSRVSPHTLTRGRERSSRELRSGVGCAHERRADEDGVRAGELGRGALGARLDAALGDHDAVGRDAGEELELRLAVDRERREVAGVHAEHPCPQRDPTFELGRVVRLDERVEPEILGDPHQPCASRYRRDRGAAAAPRPRPPPLPCGGARRWRRSPWRAAAPSSLSGQLGDRPTCRRSARPRAPRSLQHLRGRRPVR